MEAIKFNINIWLVNPKFEIGYSNYNILGVFLEIDKYKFDFIPSQTPYQRNTCTKSSICFFVRESILEILHHALSQDKASTQNLYQGL